MLKILTFLKGIKLKFSLGELNTPINMIFTPDNQIYVADAGVTDNNGKVLKYINNTFEVIADGFNQPLTGINYLDGNVYVSHRGKITVVKPDGSKVDIIEGLPSLGDHHNNQVVFGADGKMYFGQGTAASGSILRANIDGASLELVAWGLRNPFRLKFDRFNRLFSTNHGMDIRGSRPIANSPDEFHLIYPGIWYGWPDFTGGKPLPGVGHRVSRINMNTGFIYTFAINKSGYAASYTDGGGFERPIDVVFGPDENMYVVDFGLGSEGHHGYEANTGVIWKITRNA